jgi:hypothetical protein
LYRIAKMITVDNQFLVLNTDTNPLLSSPLENQNH